MSETKSNRVYLFDNIKFLLITAVVVGHFAEVGTAKSEIYKSIFVFIYAFHMPLFLFLSGMFHKNKDITKKVLMYVSLGFASKIVLFLVKLLVNGKAKFSLLSDSYLPWYMFVLAMFILASYLLRNIDKRFVLFMSVLIALFVGYDASIGDYLYLSRFFVFYPFYILGEMISKETLLNITNKKSVKIAGVAIIALWFILCFAKLDSVYLLRPLFTGRNPFSVKEVFEKWGCIYRMLCYVITVLTSFAIIALVPNKKIPLVTTFGSRTLQVYFWHWPIALILKKFGLQAFLLETPYGKLLWLLIGVLLAVFLSIKIFSFPTKQINAFCKHRVCKPKKEICGQE